MFTGIVKGLFAVTNMQQLPGMIKFSVNLSPELISDLQIGASIAIDGVCLTVVKTEGDNAWFDVMQETLDKTTLNEINIGRRVNVERSARVGDEIGGHSVSGHVYGKAQITQIAESENNKKIYFQCPKLWMKYFFSKGFIAIDGISLTLVDVDPTGTFSVCLIPETLRITTLGIKHEGDWVNIEVDAQTQTLVDTVERMSKQDGA